MSTIGFSSGTAAFWRVALNRAELSCFNLNAEVMGMGSRENVQKRHAWEVRLNRFRTSELTVARFCEQEGVSVHAFYYWLKRIRSTSGEPWDGTSGKGTKKVRRPMRNSTADTMSTIGMVCFRWDDSVDVSVPADCLDAIRCLAECLNSDRQNRRGAFQEVVLTS